MVSQLFLLGRITKIGKLFIIYLPPGALYRIPIFHVQCPIELNFTRFKDDCILWLKSYIFVQ